MNGKIRSSYKTAIINPIGRDLKIYIAKFILLLKPNIIRE